MGGGFHGGCVAHSWLEVQDPLQALFFANIEGMGLTYTHMKWAHLLHME